MATGTSKDGTRIALERVGEEPNPIMRDGASGFRATSQDTAQIAGDMKSGKPLPHDRWSSIAALVMDGGASETSMYSCAQALAAPLPTAQRTTLEGQTRQVSPEEFFTGS